MSSPAILSQQISKLTFLCSLMSYGLTDFDTDSIIDRTHSSLKSPSFYAKKRSSFSFENDSNSSWTKDEIIETMMLNVLPNMQHTHISVKREQICNQKNKVNASVLKRSASETVATPTSTFLMLIVSWCWHDWSVTIHYCHGDSPMILPLAIQNTRSCPRNTSAIRSAASSSNTIASSRCRGRNSSY